MSERTKIENRTGKKVRMSFRLSVRIAKFLRSFPVGTITKVLTEIITSSKIFKEWEAEENRK